MLFNYRGEFMPKAICLNRLFSGIVAIGLLVSPSLAEIKTFGYLGLKTGYSYEILSKADFKGGGVAYLNTSSASGYPLGINMGFGFQMTSNFGLRLEAEYLYRMGGKIRGGDLHDGSKPVPTGDGIKLQPQAEIQNWMGNFYIDYYVMPEVNLYLSAGAGKGLIGVTTHYRFGHLSPFEKTTTAFRETFVWQTGFGVGYAIMQSLWLDFNLRYTNFGKVTFIPDKSDSLQIDYPFSAVDILIGLNYRF